MVLTEKSSELTTFATPFGRFRFLRLPFGLSNAPKIFHRVFIEKFGDIKGVKVYLDDLIIYASSEREHDEILQLVLKRAREYEVKFNLNKCNFKVKQVRYVRHILSAKGISMNNKKIEAIKNISESTNVKELSRFLGIVTYGGKFIPKLSNLTANLRSLKKKDSAWTWLP